MDGQAINNFSSIRFEISPIGNDLLSNQIWTEGKILLTPRHSLNVFSETRLSRRLELVEASKSSLPVLLVEVYTT